MKDMSMPKETFGQFMAEFLKAKKPYPYNPPRGVNYRATFYRLTGEQYKRFQEYNRKLLTLKRRNKPNPGAWKKKRQKIGQEQIERRVAKAENTKHRGVSWQTFVDLVRAVFEHQDADAYHAINLANLTGRQSDVWRQINHNPDRWKTYLFKGV